MTADAILWFLDLRRRRRDALQFLGALVMIILGLSLVAGAASTDTYLHRGVENGAEFPYVVQMSGRELATNVEMRDFDPADRASVASSMANAGIVFARQQFSWAEIEPAQGTFDWATADSMVKPLATKGITVIAVIVDTPDWARPPDARGYTNAPPEDPQTFRTFMTEFTRHYGPDVDFVQLWDQPNLTRNWGGQVATGATFRPILSAGFYGARDGNPNVGVVTPELAVLPDTKDGLGDIAFVRSLYAADTAELFDVLAISLDGGTRSPDDRSVAAGTINQSRAILFRELMVANDDAATPIWATHFGWAATGSLSREQQAEYVLRGLNRAWSEWPWMGLMINWAFATPADAPAAPYAIAPAGAPTPLFDRLDDPLIQERSTVANTGFAPMESDSVTYSGAWADQHLEGRTFRTTSQVDASATIHFQGTGLIAFIRSGPQVGEFEVRLNDQIVNGGAGDAGELWSLYVPYRTDQFPRSIIRGLDEAEYTVTFTLKEPGELTLGGFVVERDPPFTWPVILLTVSAFVVLFLGVRSMIYLVAIRSGHLIRREDLVEPALPRMPDWRPDRLR